MRKTWFYLMLCMSFVFTSLAFTSCSDDDDDRIGSSAELAGTWESVSFEGWEMYNGQKEEWNEKDNNFRMVYNSDHTTKSYYKSDSNWHQESIGTWEYKNGKLYSQNWDPEYPEEDDSETDVATVLELTSTKLVIEITEKDYYEKSTWRKVNE